MAISPISIRDLIFDADWLEGARDCKEDGGVLFFLNCITVETGLNYQNTTYSSNLQAQTKVVLLNKGKCAHAHTNTRKTLSDKMKTDLLKNLLQEINPTSVDPDS